MNLKIREIAGFSIKMVHEKVIFAIVPDCGGVEAVVGGDHGGGHVPFAVGVEGGDGGVRAGEAVDDHYYRWWMTPAGTSKSPEDCTSRLSCYKTKETNHKELFVPS